MLTNPPIMRLTELFEVASLEQPRSAWAPVVGVKGVTARGGDTSGHWDSVQCVMWDLLLGTRLVLWISVLRGSEAGPRTEDDRAGALTAAAWVLAV